MRAPEFWQHKSPLGTILKPLGMLYGFVSQLRWSFVETEYLDKPVICVGNVVMGGAGKTPTALALLAILQHNGYTPHVLSRGYGGKAKSITLVNSKHTFIDVGDEPLLLAQHAPVWVSPDRKASGKKAIESGADVLILDDGLQNQSIYKDLNILVIDENQGIGNGEIFPAGPLREPLTDAILRSHGIVLIGKVIPEYLMDCDLPFFFAQLKAHDPKPGPIVAFSGIGFPEKFHRTLLDLGYDVREFVSYPDHHPYSQDEGEQLLKLAEQYKVKLVTTTKDALRLPPNLKGHVEVLEVSLEFEAKEEFAEFLNSFLVV